MVDGWMDKSILLRIELHCSLLLPKFINVKNSIGVMHLTEPIFRVNFLSRKVCIIGIYYISPSRGTDALECNRPMSVLITETCLDRTFDAKLLKGYTIFHYGCVTLILAKLSGRGVLSPKSITFLLLLLSLCTSVPMNLSLNLFDHQTVTRSLHVVSLFMSSFIY